jgi:hypothetical protein
MQDLYHKNGSTLTNEIKVNLCSWMGRFNIVNISVIHRVIDKFNMISIKIPVRFFFCRHRSGNFKIYMEMQRG